MDIGPLRIETGFEGDAAGNMWWSWSWSPARRARNKVLEEAANKIEEHARAIVAAGDQFDQGGDIYRQYRPTMQAAEIVRALKI